MKKKITIKFVETRDVDYDFGNLREDLPNLYETEVDADFWQKYVKVRGEYESMHKQLVDRVVTKKVRKFKPGIPIREEEHGKTEKNS